MLKPIAIIVVVGVVGVIGYKLLTKPTLSPASNETTLLISNAEKSVQEADESIEKANNSFKKVPLSEYKTIKEGLQASQ